MDKSLIPPSIPASDTAEEDPRRGCRLAQNRTAEGARVVLIGFRLERGVAPRRPAPR